MFCSNPIPTRARSSSPIGDLPGPLKIREDPMSPFSDHEVSNSNLPSQEDPQQHYCLKWNNYQTNLTSVFDHLLQTEAFVDVTLTSEGQVIKCHKVVLSACSPYFQSLLSGNPSQHPIVILRDIPWLDLKYIVEYMYRGEINVSQDELPSVLKSSEALNIRGLVDFRSRNQDELSGPNKDVELKRCSNKGPPPLMDFRPHKRKRASSASLEEDPNGLDPSSLARAVPTEPYSQPIRDDCSTLGMGFPLGPPSMSSSFPTRVSHPSRSPSSTQSTPQIGHSGSSLSMSKTKSQITDDLSDVKPGIMELIQEERRAKLLEASQITHSWMNHQHQQQQKKTGACGSGESNTNENLSRRNSSPIPGSSSCYQYQLQSMWQKCWNQNASALQSMRYRERGPMKSWRPETMAEAIWSVLQDGLSLSQAARKHDIPYPTFVLYANRVHNMLGPSVMDGSPTIGELRPKGRGRPQRILLGNWPEEHVRQVIRAVVFRDGTTPTYGGSNQIASSSSSSSTLVSRGTPPKHPNSIHGNHSPTLSMRGSPLGIDRRSTGSSRTLSATEEASLVALGAVPPGSGNLSTAQEQLAAQFQQIYSNHLNQFAHSLGTFTGSHPTRVSSMVKPEKENLMLDPTALASYLSAADPPFSAVSNNGRSSSNNSSNNNNNFEDADDEFDNRQGHTVAPFKKERNFGNNPSQYNTASDAGEHLEEAAPTPTGPFPTHTTLCQKVNSFEGNHSGKRDLDESIIKLRERRMKMMKGNEETNEELMSESGTVQDLPSYSKTPTENVIVPSPAVSVTSGVNIGSPPMNSHDPMNLADPSWDHCTPCSTNISDHPGKENGERNVARTD